MAQRFFKKLNAVTLTVVLLMVSTESNTLSSSHTHAIKKYHAAILLLGIQPRPLKHYVHTLSCTGICKVALFIKAKEKRTIQISVRMNN